MSSIMKFQFFSILSDNENINLTGSTKDIGSFKRKDRVVDWFSDISTIDMWVLKKQTFILCKKYTETNNEKILSYFIYKIVSNKIISCYQLYNRNIYCGKIVKLENSEKNNLINTLRPHFNEKYYLVLVGSDYCERINTQENKKELNVLTYISIIDMKYLIDKNDNSFDNSMNPLLNIVDLKPYVLKKINLVTIPNSIYLNTSCETGTSFESLSGISILDVSKDLKYIGLGLESGKVVLIYPYELSLIVNKSNVQPKTQNTSFISNNKPPSNINSSNTREVNILNSKDITAVELNEVKEKFCINSIAFSSVKNQKSEYVLLYFSTFNAIYYYAVDLKTSVVSFYQLSNTNGTFNNSIITTNKQGQVFFSTKDNLIMEYHNLSKKATFLFEGKITNPIYLASYYLVFIIYESNSPILAVYDIRNKLFAYYNNMFQQVFYITSDLFDNTVYFLAENFQEIKQIFSLKEKENSHKFNIFYKKCFYDLAFDYARNLKYNIEEISEIHKQYGDYLYKNSEYKRSVEEYCKTILYIHPSLVIEKFLDNSKIEYLIYYLEQIHESKDFKIKFKEEMTNYSKLLINIYSKMKKITKLSNFLDKIDFKCLDKTEVENIINICMDQNHIKIALNIANSARLSHKILEICLHSKSK